MSRAFFREYFNFSTREKNGLVILIAVLFIVISLNVVTKNLDRTEKVDFSQFEDEIDRFVEAGKIKETEIELFVFDPNQASESDFVRLGLPNNVINNILSYREKGGVFYNKEGFSRIWGMKDEDYERLKDYIVIENQRPRRQYRPRSDYRQSRQLFDFDPNHADFETLLKLGLRDWQADNVINYRNRGGVFNTPEDFQKIYGISERLFNDLSTYIVIDTTNIPVKEKPQRTIQNLQIEINSADAEDLRTLRGIGQVLSERIITYRERLGGFYEIYQLVEVYGVTEEVITQNLEHLTVDLNNIRKINLNDTDYRSLISHPYIDRKTTEILLEYVKFAGEIKDLNELIEQKVISDIQYQQLEPYLSVE